MCRKKGMVLSKGLMAKELPGIFSHNHELNVETMTMNLLVTKSILDSQGVMFWLWFGTFLGAYREGRLLPWDKDADLAIYEEDRPKLIECTPLFVEEGFWVQDPCGTIVRDGEHIDFEMFSLKGNRRVSWETDLPPSAFETLNTIEFLDTTWRIVSEPEKWLTYLYGANWKTPVKNLIISHPLGKGLIK